MRKFSFTVKMLLGAILGVALVANICKAAPPKSGPASKAPSDCQDGDTKEKDCNRCVCLAGQWACSFRVCYSAEEFVPGSFLCKLAPQVKGCQVTANPDKSEATPPPPSTEHRPGNATASSTAIIFPSSGAAGPHNRLCAPRTGQGPNRHSPVGMNSTSEHRVPAQAGFDIDIRRGPSSVKGRPSATEADDRPFPCRGGSEAGPDTSRASSDRPPGAAQSAPPGGDRRKQGWRRKPAHRGPGSGAAHRRRPRPRASSWWSEW